MSAEKENTMQDPTTRFSPDGCTVFVRLLVDRRFYEFARHWSVFHADADPEGTAEDQLEGYLAMALLEHMSKTGWKAPEEIENLYLKAKEAQKLYRTRDNDNAD